MTLRILTILVATAICPFATPALSSAEPISWVFAGTLDYVVPPINGPDWVTPLGVVAGAPIQGTLTINTDAVPVFSDPPTSTFGYGLDLASFTMQIGGLSLSTGPDLVGVTAGSSLGLFFENVALLGGGTLAFHADLGPLFAGLPTLEPSMLHNLSVVEEGGVAATAFAFGARNLSATAVPEPGSLSLLALGCAMSILRAARRKRMTRR